MFQRKVKLLPEVTQKTCSTISTDKIYIKPKQKVVFPPAFSHAKAVCKFSLSESVLISSLQNGDFKKIQNESTTSDWFADSRGSCYFYHSRRHLYAPFPDCVPEGHALQSVCPVLS